MWWRDRACAARHSRAWTWRDEGKTLIESGISVQGEQGEIDGRLIPYSPQRMGTSARKITAQIYAMRESEHKADPGG